MNRHNFHSYIFLRNFTIILVDVDMERYYCAICIETDCNFSFVFLIVKAMELNIVTSVLA